MKPYRYSLSHSPESLQNLSVDLRYVPEFLKQTAEPVRSTTCNSILQESLECAK